MTNSKVEGDKELLHVRGKDSQQNRTVTSRRCTIWNNQVQKMSPMPRHDLLIFVNIGTDHGLLHRGKCHFYIVKCLSFCSAFTAFRQNYLC